jgi:hypothetical protein
MSTLCPMYIILVYKPVPAYAQRREAAAAEREGVLRVDGNFVMPLQLLLTMYIIAAACPKCLSCTVPVQLSGYLVQWPHERVAL